MPNVRIVTKQLISNMEDFDMPSTEYDTIFNNAKDKRNNELRNIDATLDEDNNLHIIMSHAAVKRMAKAEVKQKFIVGHTYKLAYRKQTEYYKQKEFVLIKYIYAIKNTPVNILVMKEINPAPSTGQVKFTLNYVDCQKFHIKYQPGLEVYSMDLNWIDTTKK